MVSDGFLLDAEQGYSIDQGHMRSFCWFYNKSNWHLIARKACAVSTGRSKQYTFWVKICCRTRTWDGVLQMLFNLAGNVCAWHVLMQLHCLYRCDGPTAPPHIYDGTAVPTTAMWFLSTTWAAFGFWRFLLWTSILFVMRNDCQPCFCDSLPGSIILTTK